MQSRQPRSNLTMTNCHKGGIKIKNSKSNNNVVDPFLGLDPFSEEATKIGNTDVPLNYDNLDLQLDNYSREELFKLFGLTSMTLSEDIIKKCKHIVLKTHPDKSRLDDKYFVFFSKAYNKILGIFEFQNKTNSKKITCTNEYFDSNNSEVLDKVFETNKGLKDPNQFNSWFNDQFNKHKLEDPNDTGYGGWLKSDEDIVFTPKITKTNMASEMEKIKKHVQTLTKYEGVSDQYSSSKGSSLMSYDSNFSSGSLFLSDGIGYTDLRQAYAESVIPVSEDDFNKVKQFKNVDEYIRNRDNQDTIPLSKEESMRQLFKANKNKDEESAALAFYYAQQTEKAQKNQANFWSGLKQLTN